MANGYGEMALDPNLTYRAPTQSAGAAGNVGAFIDATINQKRIEQLRKRTAQFLQEASHRLATDPNYGSQQYVQQATARGVWGAPEVAAYYDVIKEADLIRKDKTKRERLASVYRAQANQRVPVEPVEGSLPPGMPMATGGATAETSPAAGFTVGRNQALTTRPMTDAETIKASGGIPRQVLQTAASFEEAGVPAKDYLETINNLAASNQAAMSAFNNFLQASGRTGLVTGEGQAPGTVTPEQISTGQTQLSLGGFRPSQYPSPGSGSGENIDIKNAQLLRQTLEDESQATKDLADWSKKSSTMKTQVGTTHRGRWELIKSLYEKLGYPKDFIDAQAIARYNAAKINGDEEAANMIYPEYAPAPGAGAAPTGGGLPSLRKYAPGQKQ